MEYVLPFIKKNNITIIKKQIHGDNLCIKRKLEQKCQKTQVKQRELCKTLLLNFLASYTSSQVLVNPPQTKIFLATVATLACLTM